MCGPDLPLDLSPNALDGSKESKRERINPSFGSSLDGWLIRLSLKSFLLVSVIRDMHFLDKELL